MFNEMKLNQEQQTVLKLIQNKAEELSKLISAGTNERPSREVSLAKTKLEECVMWASVAIEKKSNGKDKVVSGDFK